MFQVSKPFVALEILQDWEMAFGGDLDKSPSLEYYQRSLGAFSRLNDEGIAVVASELVEYMENTYNINDLPNTKTYAWAVRCCSTDIKTILLQSESSADDSAKELSLIHI